MEARKLKRTITTLSLAAAVGLLAGCSDDLNGPGTSGSVSLSVAGPTSTSGSASTRGVRTSRTGPGFAITQTDDEGNELVMDSVKVVLREIELERAFDDDCPEDVEDDACEEFEAGIRLFEVPLDGSVEKIVSIDVPADTYDELEFEIHKPDDDEPEGQEFIEDHPAFKDVSIRVVGTFNGEEFVFEQDLNEEQEVALDPPLVVDEENTTVNLTLKLDVTTWFVDQEGEVVSAGSLIDPREADKDAGNSAAENVVEENIKDSIEGFEDDDEDGEDDEDDDG